MREKEIISNGARVEGVDWHQQLIKEINNKGIKFQIIFLNHNY